jgi:hypothetical protein
LLGRLSSFGRLGNFKRKVLVAVHSEREVGLERAKIIGRSTCLAISLITSSENRSLTALNPKIKNLTYYYSRFDLFNNIYQIRAF